MLQKLNKNANYFSKNKIKYFISLFQEDNGLFAATT